MAYLSAEDFVIAYATSSSVEEVMKTTGMTKEAVVARASTYRKLGIKLPKLAPPRQFNDLRIAQLNSLIQKYDIRKQKRGN